MRMLRVVLVFIAVCGASRPYSNVAGVWHYGKHFSPEFCVRILQDEQHVRLEFFLYDAQTGDEFLYAAARGVFLNFYEIHFRGEYVQPFRKVPAGSKFGGRWLVYEDDTRMQEISYWGVHRITSYLIKRWEG